MTLAKNSLSVKAAKLEGLSPLKRLRQGWAYVTDDAGHNVKSVAAVAVGDRLTIELADGRLRARAEEVANLGQD